MAAPLGVLFPPSCHHTSTFGVNIRVKALLLLFKTCLVPNWHCQYLQLGFNDPSVKRTWQSPAECLHPPALLLFHTAHKNHLHEDLIRESKKVFHIWLFHLREDLIRESEKTFPPHPPPPPRHLPSRESRRRLGWKGRLKFNHWTQLLSAIMITTHNIDHNDYFFLNQEVIIIFWYPPNMRIFEDDIKGDLQETASSSSSTSRAALARNSAKPSSPPPP